MIKLQLPTFFKLRIAQNTYTITILTLLTLLAGTGYAFVYTYSAQQSQLKSNSTTYATMLSKKNANISSLEGQIKSVASDYSTLQNTDANKQVAALQSQIDTINNAFTSFANLQTLITQAKGQGINTDNFNTQLSAIQGQLLSQKYTDAVTSETSLNSSIVNSQNLLKQQQAQAAAASAAATTPSYPSNLSGSSFAVTTVNAQGKNYTVYAISIDLTSPGLHITTDTAQTSDCANNCTATNLMSFYTKDHGFAAINGTYLCPIDYSSCSEKTNSFDFPVYNTNTNTWINKGNLFWVDRSMLAFDVNNHPTFYPEANSYSGTDQYNQIYPPVHAAFVMAPGLVHNGQVIVNNYPLDTKSATAQITRGAIGIKGNTLIIADAYGCTVPQMAYIMQAMGAIEAINLDGGGSTAMIYNGQYILGPGRGIPNAIIFSRN